MLTNIQRFCHHLIEEFIHPSYATNANAKPSLYPKQTSSMQIIELHLLKCTSLLENVGFRYNNRFGYVPHTLIN